MLDSLSKIGIQIKPAALLSSYTTFQLGGACRALINCQTPDELKTAVQYLISNHLPFILIGGGSNLVVSDYGLDCYVIRYVSEKPIITREGNDVIVSGSTNLDSLASYAAHEGLEGLNYTTGIPGTVGGAVVGNAGAWGKQVGDVLKSLTILTLKGELREVSLEYCQFTYRHSHLKETGDIVVSVRFACQRADRATLLKERDEILKLRHEKHPDLKQFPCAGSFFRNIEPTSKAERRQATGWFLEEAGGKNLSYGGAKIFDKHANIIVKGQNCKAQDVYELQKNMAKLVKDKFGLDLIREVRFVGQFDQVANSPALIW